MWQTFELEDGRVDPCGSIPFHGAIAIAFKGHNYDRNEVLNMTLSQAGWFVYMVRIFKETSHA
jgi:hypothetical protein